jgi:HK97 family phage prohead protease
MIIPNLTTRSSALIIRADDALPDGIIGRLSGIAVRYDVVDSYRTIFSKGSLDKTRAKVAAGKVKLFDNHGMSDHYGTRSHIGVVRSLSQEGDGELMTADLFDTEDGRRAKEYLRAVMASGGETGLSIGFYERSGQWVKRAEQDVYQFDDIELDEISLAPRNAVPGSDVMSVRTQIGDGTARSLMRYIHASVSPELFRNLVAEFTPNESTDAAVLLRDEPVIEASPTDGDADEAPVAYAERMMRVRELLSLYEGIQ